MQHEAFIRSRLQLGTSAARPDIRLWRAHPASRLSDLADASDDAHPPYWAFEWAGGAALARGLLDHPEWVQNESVLDLGAGSGLVGIAAAKAGARRVLVSDIDAYARAAARLNAEANGMALDVTLEDFVAQGSIPDVSVILAGDVFYAPEVASPMLGFLRHCAAHGCRILIGDPGRTDLPADLLSSLGCWNVPDFGQAADRPAHVYVLREAVASSPASG